MDRLLFLQFFVADPISAACDSFLRLHLALATRAIHPCATDANILTKQPVPISLIQALYSPQPTSHSFYAYIVRITY